MGGMESLFTLLYPFVFLIGLAGFGPQIHKLLTEPTAAEGMSLSTWFMWALTWVISFGYGVTVLKDPMFCIVAGTNMTAHILVFALILYRRRAMPAPETLIPIRAQS